MGDATVDVLSAASCRADHWAMRIGELDDALGKEFAARRDAMQAELGRTAARLAEPRAATRPAVPLADSVRISPEAQAALFARAGAAPALGPFPSPSEVVAIFREIAAHGPGQVPPALVARLAGLVRQLSAGLPGQPPPGPPRLADRTAAALVRALLREGAAPEAAVALARQLLSVSAPPGGSLLAPAPTAFERATAALLMAVLRTRTEAQLPAEARPATASADLPPGLLSFAAVAPAARRPRRRKSREDDDDPPPPEWLFEDSTAERERERRAASG